eukprot:ANDGO_07514.mRNA.1 hypothetical protein
MDDSDHEDAEVTLRCDSQSLKIRSELSKTLDRHLRKLNRNGNSRANGKRSQGLSTTNDRSLPSVPKDLSEHLVSSKRTQISELVDQILASTSRAPTAVHEAHEDHGHPVEVYDDDDESFRLHRPFHNDGDNDGPASIHKRNVRDAKDSSKSGSSYATMIPKDHHHGGGDDHNVVAVDEVDDCSEIEDEPNPASLRRWNPRHIGAAHPNLVSTAAKNANRLDEVQTNVSTADVSPWNPKSVFKIAKRPRSAEKIHPPATYFSSATASSSANGSSAPSSKRSAVHAASLAGSASRSRLASLAGSHSNGTPNKRRKRLSGASPHGLDILQLDSSVDNVESHSEGEPESCVSLGAKTGRSPQTEFMTPQKNRRGRSTAGNDAPCAADPPTGSASENATQGVGKGSWMSELRKGVLSALQNGTIPRVEEKKRGGSSSRDADALVSQFQKAMDMLNADIISCAVSLQRSRVHPADFDPPASLELRVQTVHRYGELFEFECLASDGACVRLLSSGGGGCGEKEAVLEQVLPSQRVLVYSPMAQSVVDSMRVIFAHGAIVVLPATS